jgi:hypothetical protein
MVAQAPVYAVPRLSALGMAEHARTRRQTWCRGFKRN